MALDEGIAVTAWHVVDGAVRVTGKFASGEEFGVSGWIDRDVKRDIALIKVKVFGAPLLQLSRSTPPVGDKAYVVGSPEGLDLSLSDGLISQVRIDQGTKLYQFTSPVSPGSSGSPVINDEGTVLGVVSFQFKEGQNLNFSIPSTYVLGLDKSLPTKPWTNDISETTAGQIANVDDARLAKLLVESLVLNADIGTTIQWADKNILRRNRGYRSGVPSSLYRRQRELAPTLSKIANLRSESPELEDSRVYILEFLQDYAKGVELFIQAIKVAQATPGWGANANDLYSRANSYLNTRMKLSQYRESLTGAAEKHLTNDVTYILGLKDDPSGITLGVYPWLGDSRRLAIVVKNSYADRLGLRDGDTVLKIDGIPIESLSHFKLLLSARTGEKVHIKVARGNKTKTLKRRVP